MDSRDLVKPGNGQLKNRKVDDEFDFQALAVDNIKPPFIEAIDQRELRGVVKKPHSVFLAQLSLTGHSLSVVYLSL